MPCPKRFQAALQETEIMEDGVKMYTWRAVRRQHLRALRKQTRTIVFFMALIEIIRVGVVDLVYAGKHGTQAAGPEDFGIAHNVGYFIGWLYMCLFAIVYVPLFSWWMPKLSDDNSSSRPSKAEKVAGALQKLNMILLPACVGISLIQYVYHAISALIYVDARPVDSSVKSLRRLNSRRNWLVRFVLLSGIIASMLLGKGAFMILEEYDLARVKPLEYLVIVLPIQVNLGLLMGSAVQFKAEQRRNRKLAAKTAIDAESGAIDEKQRLLVEA